MVMPSRMRHTTAMTTMPAVSPVESSSAALTSSAVPSAAPGTLGGDGEGGDGDGGGGGGAWALRRVALLFGSEGSGLSAEALALADVRLSVAQCGMTQSLNVAACATLVIGEALRLRGEAEAAAAEAAEAEEDGSALSPGSSPGSRGGLSPSLSPGRLSAEEQRAAAARLLERGAPARRHNKAATKAAMQAAELQQ